MARFLAYDIKWDLQEDTKLYDGPLPSHAIVWLPGYVAGESPEDDAEAVLDKLSDDAGFCVTDHKIVWLDNLNQDGDPE